MDIKVFDGGKAPEYKTSGAAGADCYAKLGNKKYDPMKDSLVSVADKTLRPGERALIPLGFAASVPEGWIGLILPRSGMSKKGIDCATGVIDPDYRGEVSACLINNSGDSYTVYNGDRVCQFVTFPAQQVPFIEVQALPQTERGGKGFGSTGV